MPGEQESGGGAAPPAHAEASGQHALLLVGLDGTLRCFEWPGGTLRWKWHMPACDALFACRLVRRGPSTCGPSSPDSLLSPTRWHALLTLGGDGATRRAGGAGVVTAVGPQLVWQYTSRVLPQQVTDGDLEGEAASVLYDEPRACDEAVREWNGRGGTPDGGPRPLLEHIHSLHSSEEAMVTLDLHTGACVALLQRPDSTFVPLSGGAAASGAVVVGAKDAGKKGGQYVRVLWRTHRRHLLQGGAPDVALQLTNTELQMDVLCDDEVGEARSSAVSNASFADAQEQRAAARSIVCHVDGTVRMAGSATEACDAQVAGGSATSSQTTHVLSPGGMLAAYLVTLSDQGAYRGLRCCALPLQLPVWQSSPPPSSSAGVCCYVMEQANYCRLVFCCAPCKNNGAAAAKQRRRDVAGAGRHDTPPSPLPPRAATAKVSTASSASVDDAPQVGVTAPAQQHGGGGVASSLSSSSSSSRRKRTRQSVPNLSIATSACSTPWAVVTPQVASGLEFTSFFDDNFDPLRVLGRGANGAALLVRHRVTGVFYAVKVLLARDYESEREVLREMRLHSLLHSRYLVRYHVCWSEVVTHKRAQQLALIGLCRPHEAHMGGGLVAHEDDAEDESDDFYHATWRDEATSTDKTSTATGTDWGRLRRARVRHNGIYVVSEDDNDAGASAGPTTLPPTSQTSSTVSTRRPSPTTVRSILGARVIFLQMEFCQMTLKQYLDTRPAIDRTENMVIVLQLISALRYMHRLGILHRDLKPTNVFLNFQCQRLPYGTCGSEEDSDGSGLDTTSEGDDWAGGGASDAIGGHRGRPHATSRAARHTRRAGKVTEVHDDHTSDGGGEDDVETMTSECTEDEAHSAELGYGPLTTAVYFPSRVSSMQTTPRSRAGGAAAMDEAVEMLLQSSHLDAMTLLRQGGASRVMQRLARQRERQQRQQQQDETARQVSPADQKKAETAAGLHRSNEMDKMVHATARWLRHHLVQARLGDFGLAKCVPFANDAAASAQGRPAGDRYSTVQRRPTNTVGVGTPLYASPEQLRGEVCGGASDGFSLGVLFAELYMQVGTQSERLVRLQQVRRGEFLTDELRHTYPELAVVTELTKPQPGDRMRLGRAYKQIWSILIGVVAAQLRGA